MYIHVKYNYWLEFYKYNYHVLHQKSTEEHTKYVVILNWQSLLGLPVYLWRAYDVTLTLES